MSTRATTTTTTTPSPPRTASVATDAASESVKTLVSRSKWMLAFLIVTSLLAAFSFVYVCCDWSKTHKDSKSKSALLQFQQLQQQQQQLLNNNGAPARFRATGSFAGAGYPSPFQQQQAAAGAKFHDRLEKQPVALSAPFPRYLYSPDQGHDTFQRASQPRRHQQPPYYHDGEGAPQPPQPQQPHHHHRQEVPMEPPQHPQQQPNHAAAAVHMQEQQAQAPAQLPPLPSLSDDASFTLFV